MVVLSHFKIGGFVSFSKSVVSSPFRNRRFCLVFKINGFVSFKIGYFVLPQLWHPSGKWANNQCVLKWSCNKVSPSEKIRISKFRLRKKAWNSTSCFWDKQRKVHIVQCCDKEMDHNTVKKKWDSWISKNQANIRGSFGNKSSWF